MKKKNKAMRLASVLLVLTLFTTSLTAGTFAKYTTGAEGDTTARVAKFGVDVEVNTDNLFGTKYTDNNNGNSVTSGQNNISVGAGELAVAPGTTGSMTFSVEGTPETTVAVNISVTNRDKQDSNVSKRVMLSAGTYNNNGKEVTIPGNGYYPVKWTLKNGGIVVSGENNTELENTTLAAINDYFDKIFTKEYGAGKSLNSLTYTLSWHWDFDTENQEDANDGADTILGDLGIDSHGITKKEGDQDTFEEIKTSDYCLTEAFDFSITVEQVD